MTPADPLPPATPTATIARRVADGMPYALGFLAVALLLVMLAGLSIWQERIRQRERAVAVLPSGAMSKVLPTCTSVGSK